MGLNLGFNNIVAPDRYLGGSTLQGSHPYVKGYFYVFFEFPKIVTEQIDMDTIEMNQTMLALAESYSPAGDRQLKYEDVAGQGDISASFITGHTIDRNFQLGFRELMDRPIFQIHRAWTSIINPWYGGTCGELTNIDYDPESYKGKVMVIQTKPVSIYQPGTNIDDYTKVITKVDLYTGVFPITDISSVFDSNITDNSIVRIQMSYRFDGNKFDETYSKDIVDRAAKILQSYIKETDRDSSFNLA